MQRKFLSKLIKIAMVVRGLVNGPTNVAGLLVSLAIALGALSAQAVQFSQAYMTAEAVAAFYENPTMANFAKIDGYFQTLVLAEIRSMTDPKEQNFAKMQQIYQHHFSRAAPEVRAEVLSHAFQLAVIHQREALMKELLNRALTSNPDLAKAYVCGALVAAGTDSLQNQSSFDEELFAANPERIEKLLPLISQIPRLKEKACEISIKGQSDEEEYLMISISQLVAKASPKFQIQLNQSGRSAPVVSGSVLQAAAACSERQISSFLMVQVLPAFTGMNAGSVQFSRFQENQCLIDGIFKKVGTGKLQSFEFKPSNGRFGYEKDAIPFKTAEELVKILKRGFSSK